MEGDNQEKNTKPHLQPFLWKKGQSGNLKGRPKGKTMKEWAKEYLERMTDEERDEFMEGIPKEVIWKMSEGNPHNSGEVKVELRPIPLDQVDLTKKINVVLKDDSIQEDKEPE